MHDTVWIAVIAAIAPTLAAVGAIIVSLNNQNKLTKLRIEVNHRLDELITARETLAKAEGIVEGKESHS